MALDKFQPYLFVSAGEQSNKYLTPVISPEGIASFQAQRAQDLSGLTVRIDPIQKGSGDPSPTNIRPISGRTGLTVTRAGRNLIPFPYSKQPGTYNGVTITVNDDGTLVLNGTATASVYFNLVDNNSGIPMTAGTYILHKPTTVDTDSSVRLTAVKNGGYWDNASTGNVSLTLSEGANVSFYVNVVNGTTLSNVKVYPMFEYGASASAYEPYAGQTYPITWESIAGTVYGGTLDVVSGVLTVTDAQIASYAGETLPGEWISDRDVYVAGTTPTTGAQVVYKLATPQTYQLTGAEVRTIAGFNQIYSDAGPVIDIKF